jgi:hypothetical protein
MALSRPLCNICNKHHAAINYVKEGIKHYRKHCDDCGKKKKKGKSRTPKWETTGYKKKTVCDNCGFKSIYTSQMIVYYIDGDLENTDNRNLRTVCLNCTEVIKRKEVNWKRGDLQIDY